MTTTKTTYTVTLPDGSTKSRQSARPYTHAVILFSGGAWGVLRFSSSRALAEKECASRALWAQTPYGQTFGESGHAVVEVSGPAPAVPACRRCKGAPRQEYTSLCVQCDGAEAQALAAQFRWETRGA